MTPELRDRLATILERPHRLGMIGGELDRQLDHCQAFIAVVGEVVGEIPGGASPLAGTAMVGTAKAGTAMAGTAKRLGLDLGTGGGIPGIALAAARPDIEWVLLDSRTSRAAEVERCVAKAGMHPRVRVLAAQAQLVAHDDEWRQRFDVVVARSFGPPAFTAECASGFVRPGGSLVVSEPPAGASPDDDQSRWDPRGLEACGFAPAVWHQCQGARFVELRRTEAATADLPRLPPRKDRGWPS